MSKIIVCRCEDVTLSELERALALGYRDLESVKRHTAFGTGYCQGKQCVALCAAYLAAHGGAVGEAPFTPRPPTRPVPLAHLAALAREEGEEP